MILDNKDFYLKIDPTLHSAELIFKAGALLNDEVARRIKQELQNANPGKKYFLLVGSEGYFRVTKKARKMGASRQFSSHLAVVSCYTQNTSLYLLGELYNKINKPPVPTKVFYHREEAKEWLAEQMKMSMASVLSTDTYFA
jgi:hypothetical protein